MTKIEMGKQYSTRYGREVLIYATDGNGMYCVHGAHKAALMALAASDSRGVKVEDAA